jgi:uncharacterized membrane protein YebE (DUF533 family)
MSHARAVCCFFVHGCQRLTRLLYKVILMLNTKHLLEQLLQSGSALLKQQNPTPQPASNSSAGGHSGNGANLLQQLSGMLSGKGGAALAGGALGLLLGSKSGRSLGGKVLTYGGLAALGTLAYQALKTYQQQQASPTTPQPLAQLSEPQQEQHCQVLLCALIAAAKADGHIDARERGLIDAEIAKLTTDSSAQQWVDRELQKPLDPAEIAALATDQSMKAEIFLASLLVVDEENFMEKAYLQELARQLQLDPALQTALRQQVTQVITASQ